MFFYASEMVLSKNRFEQMQRSVRIGWLRVLAEFAVVKWLDPAFYHCSL